MAMMNRSKELEEENRSLNKTFHEEKCVAVLKGFNRVVSIYQRIGLARAPCN
jgi:hypothetical protein